LAPHDKLQPVTLTAAQCQARFGFPDCPYVDGMPPFWNAQRNLHTPLGTDYMGRDILRAVASTPVASMSWTTAIPRNPQSTV
jgi:ABC-type dipeptide/oligopeptide/nickel transport system permease subunit